MASSKESVQNGVSKSHFIVYLSMFEHEKHADAQFHMNTCGDLKKVDASMTVLFAYMKKMVRLLILSDIIRLFKKRHQLRIMTFSKKHPALNC